MRGRGEPGLSGEALPTAGRFKPSMLSMLRWPGGSTGGTEDAFFLPAPDPPAAPAAPANPAEADAEADCFCGLCLGGFSGSLTLTKVPPQVRMCTW